VSFPFFYGFLSVRGRVDLETETLEGFGEEFRRDGVVCKGGSVARSAKGAEGGSGERNAMESSPSAMRIFAERKSAFSSSEKRSIVRTGAGVDDGRPES